jgi:hypothetical protein
MFKNRHTGESPEQSGTSVKGGLKARLMGGGANSEPVRELRRLHRFKFRAGPGFEGPRAGRSFTMSDLALKRNCDPLFSCRIISDMPMTLIQTIPFE